MKVEINKSYDFRVLATGVYGAAYKSMKLIGIVDASVAQLQADVYTIHANMKEMISGLPDSVTSLNWLIFQSYDDSNKKLIIAYEYLDEATITEVVGINIKIEVLNASTADLTIIRRTLSELGYTFNISTY